MVLEQNGRKNLLGFDFKKQFLTYWPNLHTIEGIITCILCHVQWVYCDASIYYFGVTMYFLSCIYNS